MPRVSIDPMEHCPPNRNQLASMRSSQDLIVPSSGESFVVPCGLLGILSVGFGTRSHLFRGRSSERVRRAAGLWKRKSSGDLDTSFPVITLGPIVLSTTEPHRSPSSGSTRVVCSIRESPIGRLSIWR
jgi:hypothetical protein